MNIFPRLTHLSRCWWLAAALLINCVGGTTSGGSKAPDTESLGARDAPSGDVLSTDLGSPEVCSFGRTASDCHVGAERSIVLRAQGLRFLLLDAAGWKRLRQSNSDEWWRASHAGTDSRLAVRRWKRGQLSDSADCRADASVLWGAALNTANGHRIAELDLEAPPGYQMRAIAETEVEAGRVTGIVSGFSARMRTCVAIIYQTSAVSHQGAALVGQRLAHIVDRLLPSVQVFGIEDRLRPERLAPVK